MWEWMWSVSCLRGGKSEPLLVTHTHTHISVISLRAGCFQPFSVCHYRPRSGVIGNELSPAAKYIEILIGMSVVSCFCKKGLLNTAATRNAS